MARNGFIVEFLGLPSVGKTTLSNLVAEILRRRGLPVLQPYARKARGVGSVFLKLWGLTLYTNFVIRNPKFAFLSSRAILASGQRSNADLRNVLLTWLDISALMQRYRQAISICVIDQGIFQALWSIGFSGEKTDLFDIAKKLQALIPTPHMVVVIEASLATIERRLSDRTEDNSRLSKWIPREPDLLLRSRELLEKTKAIAKFLSVQREDMQFLVIDNDRDEALERNAKRIADALLIALNQKHRHINTY